MIAAAIGLASRHGLEVLVAFASSAWVMFVARVVLFTEGGRRRTLRELWRGAIALFTEPRERIPGDW